jgi:dihydroorotase-like cyclic amidohydrolase
VLPDGERPVTVTVHDGRIAATGPYESGGEDLGDRAPLSGPVDARVHVNEPGRTGWEGFATLNSLPPTVTVPAPNAERRAAQGRCAVDVGFRGGAVPGNLPFVVEPSRLHHRNPVTPYAGRTLYGVVKTTWLRGGPVNLDGPPGGRLLSRGDA